MISVPIQSVTARERGELEKDKKDDDKEANINDPDELVEIVFIVKDGNKVEVREVKTGIQNDDNIEIRSGISTGEEIVIGPYAAVSRKLEDGDDIIIDNEKKKNKENDKEED